MTAPSPPPNRAQSAAAPATGAPISAHRLARYCKAAKLWLLRAAGWLVQAGGVSAPLDYDVLRAIRPFIQTITRVVYALLMLKAMARSAALPSAPLHHVRPALPSARDRQSAKAPGKTAKKKTSQDPRALIAALLMLLQNLEAHARRLARRLRYGAARRIGRFTLSRRAPLLDVMALLAPACADSS